MGTLGLESVYFAEILTRFWLYSYHPEILTSHDPNAQAGEQALAHIISS